MPRRARPFCWTILRFTTFSYWFNTLRHAASSDAAAISGIHFFASASICFRALVAVLASRRAVRRASSSMIALLLLVVAIDSRLRYCGPVTGSVYARTFDSRKLRDRASFSSLDMLAWRRNCDVLIFVRDVNEALPLSPPSVRLYPFGCNVSRPCALMKWRSISFVSPLTSTSLRPAGQRTSMKERILCLPYFRNAFLIAGQPPLDAFASLFCRSVQNVRPSPEPWLC